MKNLIDMKSKFCVLILLALCSFCAISCSVRGKHTIAIKLSRDTVISDLSDSSFVPSRVMCMNVVGEDLYFSDYSGGIVVLGKDYKVKKRIGTRGQGPGELLGAAHFYVVNADSIYILNEGKHAIELFVNNEFLKHIPFPKNERLTFCTRFCVENQEIYHSTVSEISPVIVFGDGNIENHICNYTKYDKPEFSRHSTRHVLKGDKNTFFLIGCVYPVFQVYSFEGKLLKEYDLTEIPWIEEVVDVYNGTVQDPTTYFTMVQDVFYNNNKVYLLVATNKGEQYFCNTICVLDIAEGIDYTHTYQLPGDVYGTFCVSKDEILFAYDTLNASIDIVSL